MKEHTGKSEAGTDSPVAVGGFKGALQARRKAKILLVLSVLIFALLTLWGYQFFRSLNPGVEEGTSFDTSRVSEDYLTMTEPEIIYVLKKNTGLDATQLRRSEITKSQVKNFANAYGVARAMTALEERQRAHEAYKVADGMIDTKDFDKAKVFYDDFARLCLEMGNKAEVKRVADKGIALINKSSLTDKEKADADAKFEDLIWLSQQ